MDFYNIITFILAFFVFIFLSFKGKSLPPSKGLPEDKEADQLDEWLEALGVDVPAHDKKVPPPISKIKGRERVAMTGDIRRIVKDKYSWHSDLEKHHTTTDIGKKKYNSKVNADYNKKYMLKTDINGEELAEHAYDVKRDAYAIEQDAYKIDDDAYAVDTGAYAQNTQKTLTGIERLQKIEFPRNIVVYEAILGAPKGIKKYR